MDRDVIGPTLATIEHMLPKSRGDAEDAGNLVAACASCNAARPSQIGALQYFELRQGMLADGLWPCTVPTRPVRRRLRESAQATRLGRRRFALDEIFEHIARRHPGCPAVFRGELAHLVARRAWVDASIGMAFGITASNFVRDNFTTYRSLRELADMSEAEARQAVRVEVGRVLATWSSAGPWSGQREAKDWGVAMLRRG